MEQRRKRLPARGGREPADSRTGSRAERESSLAARLAAVEKRLAALESPARSARRSPPRDDVKLAMSLLDELAERGGPTHSRQGRQGAVAYAGAARFGGLHYRWVKEHAVPDVAESDWPGAAPVFEALGSPPRLTLLRALLDGARDRHELSEVLGEASTGQLYHHLRDLQTTGLVQQKKRGLYELSASAVVPLLVLLGVAFDLSSAPPAPAGESP